MNQQFGGLRAGFGVQGSCGVGGFGAAETAAGVVLSATGERGLRLQLIVRPRETCQGTVGIGATGTWWLKRNDQVISFGSIRLSSRGPIGNLVRPVQLFLVSCISSSSASREKSLKNFARLQVVSLMSTGGAYFDWWGVLLLVLDRIIRWNCWFDVLHQFSLSFIPFQPHRAQQLLPNLNDQVPPNVAAK